MSAHVVGLPFFHALSCVFVTGPGAALLIRLDIFIIEDSL